MYRISAKRKELVLRKRYRLNKRTGLIAVILRKTMKNRAWIAACLAMLVLVAVVPACGQATLSTEKRDFPTLEAAATHVWNSVLTQCHVADHSGASLDYFKTSHYLNRGAGVTELRGVTLHTIAQPVSEAERSNGVQWHGWAVAVASIYRELEHFQDPIEHPEWTKWYDGSKWNVNLSPGFVRARANDRNVEGWGPGTGTLALYIEKSDGVVKVYPYDDGLPAKPLCSWIPGTTEFKHVPDPTEAFWTVSLSTGEMYAEKRVIKKGESVDFYQLDDGEGEQMAAGWPVTIDQPPLMRPKIR